MADTLKVLAQSNPAVTTLTDIYTAPSSVTVSSITVCNQALLDGTFRIAIAVAGAADTAKQYIYYDEPVPAKRTFVATIGLTLAATDKIRAYASSGSVSFNVFGVEVA